MNKIFFLGWYNHRHSALVLHNCNKLTIHGPLLAPFLLVLDLTLEIPRAPSLPLGRGLVFLSASNRLGSDPSFIRSCEKYARRGLLTCKNYKTTVGEPTYTSAENDNYPSCVFLLSGRSRTIIWVSHLALLVPLVEMALVPALLSSLRISNNDPYRGPDLYTLRTTPPCTLPA